MAYVKNFRTPTQLTAIARDAFDAIYGGFVTAGLLPSKETPALDYTLGSTEGILPPAASFRSFNTASDVGSTSTRTSSAGKLPPISRRLHVDEHTQLSLYVDGADRIGMKFEEYAELIAQAIAQRFVLAAAEAIQTGKIVMTDRDQSYTVDFGRKAGLTANAATVWSNAAADPFTDLNGFRAVKKGAFGRVIISRTVMSYLQVNTIVRQITFGTTANLVPIVTEDAVKAAFRQMGFGELVVNEEVLNDQSGTEVPLFAADKVIIVPSSGSVGNTLLGITEPALATENGISLGEAPGLFAGALSNDDPGGYDVLVNALGLPVVQSPDATAVLDVL